MRLGEGAPLKVDDMTLLVNFTLDDQLAVAAIQKELPEDENDPAHVEFLAGMLTKYTVGISGLEDENGKPITELTRKVVGKLRVDLIKRFFQGLMTIGDETDIVDESGNQ